MNKKHFDHFLDISVVLTGFNRVELQGTGLAPKYFNLINSIVGDEVCGDLWTKAFKIISKAGDSQIALNEQIRNELISNKKFGPVVRNIIKLWYLGQWDALPTSWRDDYGNNPADVNMIISSSSYREGLVWVAIGAHPMGAKQPGFGTWSHPPKAPDMDT